MAVEQYANNFATSLASALSLNGTSMNVSAAAPVALQGGQFRVAVATVDPLTGLVTGAIELMLVTAGAATTSWTVARGIEGTSNATHAGGSTVTHVLTAASLLGAAGYDVRTYGATGDGSTDDTAAIQAAIDAATAAGGGIVTIPGGTWIVDGLVLKGFVTLRGAGCNTTFLKAKASSAVDAVLLLDDGPVVYMNIEDIGLLPNGNAGQMGIYFQSVADGTTTGGWWYGQMRRVQVGVSNNCFTGHAIWLRGGGDDMLCPHQFLELDQVVAWGTATGSALVMTGQVGQVQVIGGGYDGPGRATGAVAYPGIRLYRTTGDDSVTETSTSTAPYSINFIGVTVQSNVRGIVIRRGFPILISGCHFEELGQAVTAEIASLSVTVAGCSFGNSMYMGDASGYAVQSRDASYVHCRGNVLFGTDAMEKHFSTYGAYMTLDGNYTSATLVSDLLTLQLSVASNAIATLGAKTVLVNTSASEIADITSSLATGEMLFVRPTGGSIVLNTSGNIWLGNRTSPYTLAQDSVACFVRYDIGGFAWNLVSVSA